MKQISIYKTVLKLALAGMTGLLVACGSSSDSSVSATTPDGYVVAAPVSGASVVVKDAAGNTIAGPVTTASDGSYNIDPGSASSGIYILESSGGSYTDEATLKSTTAGTLMAYVDGANLAVGSQVQVTAASTIVHSMVVDHGMTLSAALAAFEDTFGFAADSAVAPADATNPAADATSEELLAGLRMAAFSQLTLDLGLAPSEQFELLAALAEDLADGSLDGENAGSPVDIIVGEMLPIDILSRFSQALVAFHNSLNNLTGLASDMIGVIPFAEVALTNSYKIEYVPGMMAEMEGKTMFTLRISDVSGPVSGLPPVTLMPMMYMADHKHSTPNLDCEENVLTAGDYDCTVYYLMPSVMATGMSMGYWELTVMAGMGESATFYPKVMMAMGDTPKAVLKGQTDIDMIMGMDGPKNRNWIMFKESLEGMGDTRTYTMFIAAMESMMSYPAVSVGTVLNSGTSNELTVATMTVEVSTDETNWVLATDNGNGIWSANPVAGLVDDTEGKIYVRLTVNGDQKTTDGAAPTGDGIHDYAAFTVTPGGM